MSDLGFDPSLKKKKKSKKAEDAPAALAAASAPADMDEMFAGLKKKKKSKKTGEDADESAAALLPGTASVDDLGESLGDLGLKKKKKKSAKLAPTTDFDHMLEEAGLDEVAGAPAEQEDKLSTQARLGLPYEDLLLRFFSILKQNNPELAGDRSGPKFKIPPPVCQREGLKKTLFANVQDIATVLQRNPEHLIQFLFAELGTSGSIDGEKRLVLKGKFQPKQMESVLRRYIIEYVTCKTCKSMNTELKRESANRLHFLSCKACGSTRSVSSIKTGFQAQIGRRKRV
ncbi:translation initiation factor 2 subunit beta aeIF-2b [Metschnikowia aff. pulcherrima]|uniref:Translation initiation factor 2 subunit beta aeIF-2b n=2 Tax=Metschnikowia TaxID=27320 RepID=A0A4P6XT79_9ASCO|nr:translation initiation factor 2 subunit beta aeIF-2b [Metschnikowia aff. pulcherrima]